MYLDLMHLLENTFDQNIFALTGIGTLDRKMTSFRQSENIIALQG